MWKSVERKDSLAPLHFPTPPRNLNRSHIGTASPALGLPGTPVAFNTGNGVPQTPSVDGTPTDNSYNAPPKEEHTQEHKESLETLNQQIQRLNERLRLTSDQHSYEVIHFEKEIQEKDRINRTLEEEKIALQSEVLDLKRKLLAQEKQYQDHRSSAEKSLKALQGQGQELLQKYDVVNQNFSKSTKEYNEKLDMTTSRILELETILSLVKVETEERLKANGKISIDITQDQIRFKDYVLQISSKVEQYHQVFLRIQTSHVTSSTAMATSHHIDMTTIKSIKDQLDTYLQQVTSIATQLESKVYDMLQYQQKPTILTQETSDLFETINTLNNTIKSLKSKASLKVKKVTDQYHELDVMHQRVQQQLTDLQHQHEVLSQEHQLHTANYDALQHQYRTLQLDRDRIQQQLDFQTNQSQQTQRLLQEEKQSLQSKLDYQLQEVQRLQTYSKSLQQEVEMNMKQQVTMPNPQSQEELQTLKMEMEILQEEHKRKLQKRKKELKYVYEEHKQLREQYLSQHEILQMAYEDLYTQVYRHEQQQLQQLVTKQEEKVFEQVALERKTDELRIHYEIIQHQLQHEIQECHTTLQSEQQQVSQLQQQLQQSTQIIELRNKKIKTLVSKLHDFEGICQELRQCIQSKEQEVQAAQLQARQHLQEVYSTLQSHATTALTQYEQGLHALQQHVEDTVSKYSKQLQGLQEITSQLAVLLKSQQAQHLQHVNKLKLTFQSKLLKYEDMLKTMQSMVTSTQEATLKEAEVMQLQVELKELQSRCHTLTHQTTLLQEESQYLQHQIQQKTTQYEEANQRIQSLELQFQSKQEEVTEKQDKIDSLQVLLTSKQEQINHMHHQLTSNDSIIQSLTTKCDQYEEKEVALQEEMISKQFALEQVTHQLTQSQMTLKILQDSLETGLLQELERCKQEIQEKTKQLEANKVQMSQQEAQLEEVTKALTSCQQDLQSYQQRCTEQETGFGEKLMELHREKQTLVHQINYSTTNYLQLKQETSQYQSTIAMKEMEIEELSQRLLIYKQEYRKQEKEMANMMEMFQQEFFTLQSQITDITAITSSSSGTGGEGVTFSAAEPSPVAVTSTTSNGANTATVSSTAVATSPKEPQVTSTTPTPSSANPKNDVVAPMSPPSRTAVVDVPEEVKKIPTIAPRIFFNTIKANNDAKASESINDMEDSPLKTSKLSKEAIAKRISQNKQGVSKLRKETLPKPRRLLEEDDEVKAVPTPAPAPAAATVDAEDSIALAPSDIHKHKDNSNKDTPKDVNQEQNLEDIINQAAQTLQLSKAMSSNISGIQLTTADIRKIIKTAADGNVVSTPKRKPSSSKSSKRPTTPSKVSN